MIVRNDFIRLHRADYMINSDDISRTHVVDGCSDYWLVSSLNYASRTYVVDGVDYWLVANSARVRLYMHSDEVYTWGHVAPEWIII
jgi:hypothetical protein